MSNYYLQLFIDKVVKFEKKEQKDGYQLQDGALALQANDTHVLMPYKRISVYERTVYRQCNCRL